MLETCSLSLENQQQQTPGLQFAQSQHLLKNVWMKLQIALIIHLDYEVFEWVSTWSS